MTFEQAHAIVRALSYEAVWTSCSLTRTGYVYRLTETRRDEVPDAYYTNDLEDAVTKARERTV